MSARIVAERLELRVPADVHGGHEAAAVNRALTFAQFAAGVGSPVVASAAPAEDGAYLVVVVEASSATAAARDDA